MGHYLESVIGRGDKVLHRGRVSLASYWVWFLAGGLAISGGVAITAGILAADVSAAPGLLILVLGTTLLLPPLTAALTTELIITNCRMVAKTGLFNRSSTELHIGKIERIEVDQSRLGRILNYGDILVIGTCGSRKPIPRISNPLELRKKFRFASLVSHVACEDHSPDGSSREENLAYLAEVLEEESLAAQAANREAALETPKN